ncbi:MAG: hypothetical protein HZC40_15765 [Chloroflexi bacterium]|nr:hypothetical protein [Chloroflexota bacterium]
MFVQRFFNIAIAVSLILVAALTGHFAIATSAVISNERDSDYALRHPGAIAQTNSNDASDWFERHRDPNTNANTGASDWYERHRDPNTNANMGASDWYERHRGPNPIVGASDWYERHRNFAIR